MNQTASAHAALIQCDRDNVHENNNARSQETKD